MPQDNTDPLLQDGPLETLNRRRRKERAREEAFVRSLYVVFLLMLASFAPYAIVIIVTWSVGPSAFRRIVIASILLLLFNCSVNWIVYGVMNRSFRRGYVKHVKRVLVNLALADCLTLGYWMTFTVLDLIFNVHPVVNGTHCVFNAFLIYACRMTYVVSLMGISLDRYIHVCHIQLYVPFGIGTAIEYAIAIPLSDRAEAYTAITLLLFMNCAVNWIVYGVMNLYFRREHIYSKVFSKRGTIIYSIVIWVLRFLSSVPPWPGSSGVPPRSWVESTEGLEAGAIFVMHDDGDEHDEVLSGVVGNLLLLAVIISVRTVGLRSYHNFLLSNLAVANLLTTAYWVPFIALDLILGYHPVVNNAHCIANAYIIHVCTTHWQK
nr:hypothetical protein BaRGS_022732 [Batillaria attramentaria]